MTNEEKRQQRGNTIVGIILVAIIAIGLVVHYLM